LSLGILIGTALLFATLKFLPSTSMWGRLVLDAEVSGRATSSPDADSQAAVSTGVEGVVVSPLRPTGTIEIAGRRYEARSEVGELAAGARIRVVRRSDFGLIVEGIET